MVLLLAMLAKPMSMSLGHHSIHLMARRTPPRSYARAIKEMLSHNEPALLDVVTAKEELSMPPTIEPEQVKGFSL
jgi:pyruvate dehydrogenase (quinone)